jgi:G3E family GTPase
MLARHDPRIPIFVLTGFLGAGKTTVLSSLLTTGRLSDTLLLINEVGETGIDQDLLRDSALNAPVLLPGGCMCCSLKGDLGYTLRDMEHRLERGLAKLFKQVVIETTGIADPAPILRAILSDRWIAARYRIGRTVAVADAQHVVETCRDNEVAISQLVHADTVLLSKTDIVSGTQAADVISHTASLAPHAELLDARDALELGWAFDLVSSTMTRSLAVVDCCRLHSDDSLANEPLHGVRTLEVRVREQIPWNTLSRALDEFSMRNSKTLLRLKGIVCPKETTMAVCVQSVRTTFYPPKLLDGTDLELNVNKIVVIHRGELCERSLDNLRTTAGYGSGIELPADLIAGSQLAQSA